MVDCGIDVAAQRALENRVLVGIQPVKYVVPRRSGPDIVNQIKLAACPRHVFQFAL